MISLRPYKPDFSTAINGVEIVAKGVSILISNVFLFTPKLEHDLF